MGSANPDEFCLRWNDFESNISGAFRTLRNDEDFYDVTLACQDHKQGSGTSEGFRHRTLHAHKIILSTCSPYFRSMLRQLNGNNRGQIPFVVMRGVSYQHLSGILDFMYHGEVNICQNELDDFLALAEELQVRGLTQNGTSSTSNENKASAPSASASASSPKKRKMASNPEGSSPFKSVKAEIELEDGNLEQKQEIDDFYEDIGEEEEELGVDEDQTEDPGEGPSGYDTNDSVMVNDLDLNEEAYKERINRLVKQDSHSSMYHCSGCSHSSMNKTTILNHIESVHLKLRRYLCKYCGQTFLNKNSRSNHVRRRHKEQSMLSFMVKNKV